MSNPTDAITSSDGSEVLNPSSHANNGNGNGEGAQGAEVLTPASEADFISFLVFSFLGDDYHRTDSATIARINALIRAVGPEYAAKATLFARHRLGTRNAALLAAGELSQLINGQLWAANFYRRLPRRPDDVLALLVYIRARYKTIPSRVKRGLGSYLRSCSEATLARYAGEKFFSLKLVDAVNLLHPKHSDPLGKLVRGTLPNFVPGTGSNGEKTGELWLIDRHPTSFVPLVREIDLMA
jgi:60 kDa SS-A/Ro ribonucleoprotein